MRKIGFIDYFLDEWHANNYPAWIADPRNFGRYEIAYAWADADKPGGLTTGEWCAKFRVARSASIDELIGKSDCVAVLSPDNPERHEALSELALRSGKPVYVDKTFAVTREAADRMFDLAEKYSTPMYSTSALRYAKELGWLRENGMAQADVQFASARGPGIFANYSIHQIEMIVTAMGTGAKRAIAHGPAGAPVIVYEYAGGRASVVNHLPWSGFSLAVQDALGRGTQLSVEGNMWEGFIDELLRFFDTGVPPVPRAETCEAIAMFETGMKALQNPGQWISIS